MKDLFHVAIGGGGLVRRAAVLTRVQVRSVPVLPVVLRMRLLVVAVVLRSFVEELGKGRDVHGSCSLYFHSRPGSRVVISWSSHRFPSGSSKEANEK